MTERTCGSLKLSPFIVGWGVRGAGVPL